MQDRDSTLKDFSLFLDSESKPARKPRNPWVDHCTGSKGVIYNQTLNTWRPAPCGKCDYCKRLKQWKLRQEIDYGMEGLYRLDGYMTFFTLTTSYQSDPDLLMKYWATYRRLIANYNYKFEYVIIPEFKGHLAHIHGLGNRFIPHSIMQAAWWTSTRKTAWKVDVRKVDMTNSPSKYLTKYISKGLTGEGKHKRRVMFSQGFPRRPKSVKSEDSYVYMSYEDFNSIKAVVSCEKSS